MDRNEFLQEQLDLIKRKKTDPNIEWQDVADFRESFYGEMEHRDTVRKGSKLLQEYIDGGWDLVPSSSIDLGHYTDSLSLKKERMKLQSEKIELNRWIRELSRDELIAEKIVQAINKLEPLDIPDPIHISHSNRDYLLTLADAHFGVEFKIKGLYGETLNEYSPEIFKERMWVLYYKILDQIQKDNIKILNIFELGDGLDGILRANSQLMQLRYGIVDSAVLYADFLSEWLNRLSFYVKIKFQMVKHSNHNQLRIVGQPKNSFPDEDMSKTILTFLKERLKDNPNITIIENATGYDYAQLSTYTVLGGHFETRDLCKSLMEFSKSYQTPIDYIISGHWHSRFSNEVGVDSECISVRSLIGINPYSMSINKTANAGASMFVFEVANGIVAEYRYKL